MGELRRESPVRFDAKPVETEVRDHWTVVAAYENEGPGPWLADLCHHPRWDLQDGGIDDLQPAGLAVPPVPGACRLENGILVNRMNRTQAAIWHLGDGAVPELPAETGYTDVSEATVFLALFGPGIFSIAEKLTALDFLDPGRQAPFLVQGPFSHVPCQVVVLYRKADGTGVLLLTCSRGYAHDMVHAILSSGAEFGLRPAGEAAFERYLATIEAS